MIAEYGINTPTSQNPTTNYLTTDNLGTPRINTDTYGNVSARHDYLPFGEEIIGIGGRTAAGYNSDSIRQKFTGYQRDIESGLDFAQARYYAPNAGRFTSVDPLIESAKTVNPQTLNRYTYVLNNPYRMIDPTGLEESPLDSETELAFGHLGNLVDSAEYERQAERDAAREEAEKKKKQQSTPAQQGQQTNPENNQQGQVPRQAAIGDEDITVDIIVVDGPKYLINQPLGNNKFFTGIGVLIKIVIADAKSGKPIKGAVVKESNIVKKPTGEDPYENPNPKTTESDGAVPDVFGYGVTTEGKLPLDNNVDNDEKATMRAPMTRVGEQTLFVTTAEGKKYKVVYERTLTNETSDNKVNAPDSEGNTFKFSYTDRTITRLP